MTDYNLKAIIPPSIAARDAKEQRRKLLEEVRKRRYALAQTRIAKEKQAYQQNEDYREYVDYSGEPKQQ